MNKDTAKEQIVNGPTQKLALFHCVGQSTDEVYKYAKWDECIFFILMANVK